MRDCGRYLSEWDGEIPIVNIKKKKIKHEKHICVLHVFV